jgi:hypothetical protein
MQPYLTERILQQSAMLAPLGAIAVQLRERLDGSGYPRALAGGAISRPARLPAGAGRNRAWGAVDRMATEQAPGIPFLWDTVPTVEADDVRGVVNDYSTSWDLSFTSLKQRSEQRAPDEHEHDDRRHHGHDPHQRPKGLLLGAQRVEHYST